MQFIAKVNYVNNIYTDLHILCKFIQLANQL